MNNGDQEEPNRQPSPASGFGLDDVFYTLFRRKRIILAGIVLGLIGAGIVRLVRQPIYESHAEISVPYITESTGVGPSSTADQIKATDPTGLNVLNMELRILSAFDLATQVAQKVGPEKILAAVGGGNDLMAAAWQIDKGLKVENPTRAATLTVSFRHPDEKVVQPVLTTLIAAYQIKSSEIHQGVNAQVDHLLRKRAESRVKLDATEEAIKQLKTQSNFLFPEETKEAYKRQIARVQDELFLAREELAGLGGESKAPADQNTNATETVVEPVQAEDYQEVIVLLEELKKRQRRLVNEMLYTENHPEVIRVKQQIEDLTRRKSALETENHALALLGRTPLRPGTNTPPKDFNTQSYERHKLITRVAQLTISLTNLQTEAARVMELEPKIAALQRQYDDEQKDYQFYSSKLEKAQDGVTSGNMTDVRVVQSPTPPGLDNRKLKKMIGAAFAGCVGLGLGLAFLLDLVLDRTIKRSSDVKRHLRLPVLLTVPDTAWSGGWRPAWLARGRNGKVQRYDPRMNSDGSAGEGGIAPWNPSHHLRRYTDGLRERLVTYFEVNQVTHQPKLVAVTSCGEGVGVTTLASGLAASLSMTGNGNVLLVDMTVAGGATQSFHKGKLGCDLSELAGRPEDPATVSSNLYLASVPAGGNTSEALPKALPSVFNDMIPKLKVSGYDYIVFEMPPVSQTSLTPRLSSHMDIALLVLESEKTSKHVAGEASTLMREARANVAAILNRCKAHVPAAISTGF